MNVNDNEIDIDSAIFWLRSKRAGEFTFLDCIDNDRHERKMLDHSMTDKLVRLLQTLKQKK